MRFTRDNTRYFVNSEGLSKRVPTSISSSVSVCANGFMPRSGSGNNLTMILLLYFIVLCNINLKSTSTLYNMRQKLLYIATNFPQQGRGTGKGRIQYEKNEEEK